MEQMLLQLGALNQRLQTTEQRFDSLSEDLKQVKDTSDEENRARKEDYKELKTQVTETKEMIKEMSDVFETLKSGIKVLGWLGNFAKWVGGIVAAGAAIYTFYEKLRGRA
jgi:DNA repair exonuclease SbcCD ATPase subunit